MPEVSVIIPAWNEALELPETLRRLEFRSGGHECLVVDGGSTDGTCQVAETSGARVVVSPIQRRAAQLNLGAAQAKGDILLFLHADTWLPHEWLAALQGTMAKPRVVGGGFARGFRSDSWFLKLTCLLAEGRNRVWGWHLGDQAIFARREIFQQLGGFPDWPRFEDLEFSRRLGRKGSLVTLRPRAFSSARRFAGTGPVSRTWRDFWLTMRYMRGMEPVEARKPRPLP